MRDGRKIGKDALAIVRRKAVESVLSGELTQTQAAEVFGVARATVCCWVAAFRRDGAAALTERPRGRQEGGELRITPETGQWLLNGGPETQGLSGLLWNREQVAALLRQKQGTSVSRWTVGRLFRRWGLAICAPPEETGPCGEQRAGWLKETYPGLRQQAARERRTLWFLDETTLYLDEIGPCNALTALTLRGDLHFLLYRARLTTLIFVDFLERLRRMQEGRRLLLVMDTHTVHRAQAVDVWLREHEDAVQRRFLPPRSL